MLQNIRQRSEYYAEWGDNVQSNEGLTEANLKIL